MGSTRALQLLRRVVGLGADPRRARALALEVGESLLREGRAREAREALGLAAGGGRGELPRLQDRLLERLGAERGSVDPRLFQAYGLGLGRTGTASLAGLFVNYRSWHEFDRERASRTLAAHREGRLSADGLKDYVLKRDRAGLLEMDSSHVNTGYLEALRDLFPAARFVFLVRDCYSWADSTLNHLLAGGRRRGRAAGPAGLPGPLDEVLDGLMDEWTRINSWLLDRLPPERSLTVRTHELSASLGRIAAFVGVPAESLSPERSRLNAARRRFELLRGPGSRGLQRRFERRCGPLMRKLFPGWTLARFLAGGEG